MKVCRKCHETKPLDGFNRDKGRSDGRRSRCKACDSERHAAYRAANAEKIAAYQRRRRGASPDYFRAYRAENPHMYWEGGYRRRARMFGFEPVVESFTRSEMVAYWGNGERCIYCDGPFQEIDHLIPVGLGGHHVISNVAPSCVPCNRQNTATVRATRVELGPHGYAVGTQ